MVDPAASRFWQAAERSGLIDAAALRACWEALPEEKRTPEAIDRRLARQAVNAGRLTFWQAQQILLGRVTGFQIDRYTLLDLVGQGGMGRVYLAKDTRLVRKVALKVLSKERMTNPRAIARFRREAKVGAQLQHENLVRIYDEGESNTVRYLVMEYIAGKNIGQLIGEQGAIPWPAAAGLARQVALGLEHAHQKGLIHRDVNPCNILVTHDGTAKLTDLGLAIDLADEENVTRDGATVGTFDYISPEQARHSRAVDTRADIYSLGCTLYHMIAGRVPFAVPSLPEKLYAHQLREADPLVEVVDGVPEGLSLVVQTMMRKAPEDRYATPLGVAHALEPFTDESVRIDPTATPVSGLRSVPVSAPGPATLPNLAPAPARTLVAAAVRLDDATSTSASPSGSGSGLIPGSETSDPGMAIFAVDTGPEVSLSASLSNPQKPRTKPKSAVVRGGEEGPESKVWGWPRRVAAAALALMAIGGGAYAIVTALRSGWPMGPGTSTVAPSTSSSPNRDSDLASVPPAISSDIVVKSKGNSRSVSSLADAISVAGGNGGEIVLNTSSPLRIDGVRELRIGRGNLTIRAADGSSPVLAFDVAGATPGLTVTPGASLTLRGLRIIAQFKGQAPLIHSGGSLTIERCSIVAMGTTADTRAVEVEGPRFSAEGSLFAGFDRAIDVTAYPGAEVSVRRSMIVRGADGKGQTGWAFRLRAATTLESNPAAANLRRLVVERSTIQGGGFLDLTDFSTDAPLTVEADHVAIQAPALIAWTPRVGDMADAWPKALKWSGKGNRLDLTGGNWVVLPVLGEPTLPAAPNDLATWSAAVGSDKDSVGQSFQFVGGNPAPSDSIEPSLLALAGDAVADVGADPKLVGPPARE